MITQEELRRIFDYRDGHLIWKIRLNSRTKIGDIVGSLYNDGYRHVQIYGKRYVEHRLIWMYYNGDILDGLFIDHINRIPDDNRIENLRLVTLQENQWNRSTKCCFWDKANKKWRASIRINGKKKYLGYFDNKVDANNAYLEAKSKYHIIEDRI